MNGPFLLSLVAQLSLVDWLIVFVIGALGALSVSKIRLHGSERLLQLANVCGSVTDEGRRKHLESSLCISLEKALDSSRINFVEYYKNVSQLERVLYISGSALVLVALSFALIRSLFLWILPQIESLAADTVIAAQYEVADVIEDIASNLGAITIGSLISIPSIVWLFTYIGERLPIVCRIAFKSKKKIAEPRRKSWHHIILTSMGFTLPITLSTYAVYWIYCTVSLNHIEAEELIQDADWIQTDDKVTKKLKGARLILYYGDICDQNLNDEKKEEEKKIQAILKKLDQGDVRMIINTSGNQCLEKALTSMEGRERDDTGEMAPDEAVSRLLQELDRLRQRNEGIE